MNNPSEKWIDYVRSVAVLAVFIRHWLGWIGCDICSPKALQLSGIFGVILFFVITSYVLTLSIQRERSSSFKNLCISFYIRRVFRIYPLAVLVIFLTLNSVNYVFPWETILSNILLIQNLTLQQDVLGTLWSLPVEVQMYFFLPFFYKVLRTNKKLVLVFYLTLVVMGLAVMAFKLKKLEVFSYSPIFFIGIFCALKKEKINTNKYFSWILLIVSYIFYLGLGGVSQTLIGYFVAILVGFVILSKSTPGIHCADIVVRFISEYSYGIYLFHALVLLWMNSLPIKNILYLFFIYSVCTMALAFISYHIIEVKFINFGKFFSRKIVNEN